MHLLSLFLAVWYELLIISATTYSPLLFLPVCFFFLRLSLSYQAGQGCKNTSGVAYFYVYLRHWLPQFNGCNADLKIGGRKVGMLSVCSLKRMDYRGFCDFALTHWQTLLLSFFLYSSFHFIVLWGSSSLHGCILMFYFIVWGFMHSLAQKESYFVLIYIATYCIVSYPLTTVRMLNQFGHMSIKGETNPY